MPDEPAGEQLSDSQIEQIVLGFFANQLKKDVDRNTRFSDLEDFTSLDYAIVSDAIERILKINPDEFYEQHKEPGEDWKSFYMRSDFGDVVDYIKEQIHIKQTIKSGLMD